MNGKQKFNITDYEGNILWSEEIEVDVRKSNRIELKPLVSLKNEFKFEIKPFFFVWFNSYYVKDEEKLSINQIDTACRNAKYNLLV